MCILGIYQIKHTFHSEYQHLETGKMDQYSKQRTQFSSQHMYGNSELSVSTASGDLTPFYGLHRYWTHVVHTCEMFFKSRKTFKYWENTNFNIRFLKRSLLSETTVLRTFIQLIHRHTQRTVQLSAEWHPLIPSSCIPNLQPHQLPHFSLRSHKSCPRQAPLTSAYSIPEASLGAGIWTGLRAPERVWNILAKNSSEGEAQAHHVVHVKKIPYIFHVLIRDSHRNRPRL